MKIDLELSELIALKTLLIVEIEKIEKKSKLDEYDKNNLDKYKNILKKLEKQMQ